MPMHLVLHREDELLRLECRQPCHFLLLIGSSDFPGHWFVLGLGSYWPKKTERSIEAFAEWLKPGRAGRTDTNAPDRGAFYEDEMNQLIQGHVAQKLGIKRGSRENHLGCGEPRAVVEGVSERLASPLTSHAHFPAASFAHKSLSYYIRRNSLQRRIASHTRIVHPCSQSHGSMVFASIPSQSRTLLRHGVPRVGDSDTLVKTRLALISTEESSRIIPFQTATVSS